MFTKTIALAPVLEDLHRGKEAAHEEAADAYHALKSSETVLALLCKEKGSTPSEFAARSEEWIRAKFRHEAFDRAAEEKQDLYDAAADAAETTAEEELGAVIETLPDSLQRVLRRMSVRRYAKKRAVRKEEG